jgi:predicted ATP-binding protein involved in virulence
MPGFEALRGPLDQVPTQISRVDYFDEFYNTVGPHFEIDQLPQSLDVAQLSDGERGSLALVLDLTRRLAQANPKLRDPASESEAVVLIDELELHLHPKWQRTILQSLTATFPKCQFIATTHSPQVIGEVEHERIQIIADGTVYSPTHSYGVDSSRVLEEVMGSDPRAKEVQSLLAEVSQVIGRQDFRRARELLGGIVQRLGETDPEVTRIRTLLDFVEGKE